MSLFALNWAFKLPLENTGLKFLLVALCNYADEAGYCYPSQAALASITAQNERTVRRHIKELEDMGLITREERRGVGGHRISDGFFLNTETQDIVCRPKATPVDKSLADIVSACENDEAKRTITTGLADNNDRPSGHCVRYTKELYTFNKPSITHSAGASAEAGLTEAVDEDDGFLGFYGLYPKQIGQEAARKAYRAARERGASLTEIKGGVRRYADYADRAKLSDRFIPHPARWLSEGRWSDVLPALHDRPTAQAEPWKKALAEIARMSAPQQNNWVLPLKAIVDGGHCQIIAPTAVAYDFLKRNYESFLLPAVQCQYADVLSVQLQCAVNA